MDPYDVVFIGHYTKDTIVSSAGVRIVDGGAFNYGAHVAARMGLRVAAVTRLAAADQHVLDRLARLGVDVRATTTPASTYLRLEYPSPDPDERQIYVTSTAGPFTLAELDGLAARAYVVGASIRGEVGPEIVAELARWPGLLAVDVQGFVRVLRAGRLAFEPWPEAEAVLRLVDVVKCDAVEARMLTGLDDHRAAARTLAGWGAREIVLTHRDGLLVHAGGRYHEAPFRPRKLVGRSGRGDTCLAAYVARRLSHPPAEATRWAAAVTSLKLEAEGPFTRDLSDVEALLRKA